MRTTTVEQQWTSIEALAHLAGATVEEARSLECLDRRDYGDGLTSCVDRDSDEPCPICWALVEHARLTERIF